MAATFRIGPIAPGRRSPWFGCPRRRQRFPGGLVFKAHRLCVSLSARLESKKEEEEVKDLEGAIHGSEVPAEGDAVQFSIQGQLLHRNVQQFRRGLVFKAHRLVGPRRVSLSLSL